MRRRKKHTNSCLLRLLGLIASSGFVLLGLVFGLYMFTERPVVYEEDTATVEVEQNQSKNQSEGSNEAQEALPSDQVVVAEQADESVQASVALPEEKFVEEPVQALEQEVGQASLAEPEIQKSDEREVAQDKEVTPQTSEEENLEFEEVLVYDSYILQLDEEILGQIGDSFKNGQIDYAALINEMFSSLSFADQVRLLNLILSKVQTVNINEVWNMIKDGVNEEDSTKLQQLVQEHFTLEELNELYSYYEDMELAQNEQ